MQGITPRGLELKKRPAFAPISEDFMSKWDDILFKAEKDLVKLLLFESDVVIEKINLDIQQHLLEKYPNNFDNKRLQMEKNQAPLIYKLKKDVIKSGVILYQGHQKIKFLQKILMIVRK